MDPEEFFRQLAKAQGRVQAAQSRGEYHKNRFTMKIMEYDNECSNPHVEPGTLDVLRNQAHDILDQYLDAIAEPKQIADQFRKDPRMP